MTEPTRYILLPAYGFTGPVLGSRKLQAAGTGSLRLDACACTCPCPTGPDSFPASR